MASSNSNKHFTLDERIIIEKAIHTGATKSAIAITLGKDKSTVGKEIKLHRTLTYKCKLPLECAVYKKCKSGRECYPECLEYIPFSCTR